MVPNIVYDAKDGYLLMFGGSSVEHDVEVCRRKVDRSEHRDRPAPPGMRELLTTPPTGAAAFFGGTNPHFLNDTWSTVAATGLT